MQANAGESCRTVVFLKKRGEKAAAALLAAVWPQPPKKAKALAGGVCFKEEENPHCF